jgi:hypothetical protein
VPQFCGHPTVESEVQRLRREVRELRMERDILKKAVAWPSSPNTRDEVSVDRGGEGPVSRTLRRCLAVSRSGYYAWAVRQPSARARADVRLTAQLRLAHADSQQRYG